MPLLIVLMLLLLPAPARAADAPYAGRLYVEEVGISVALYRTLSQDAVDQVDSAAYFDLSGARGHMIAADHCNQAFRTLGKVQPGTTARIVGPEGTITHYTCTAIFRGHNTGGGITDWAGRSVVGQADLLMYTCFDGWQNIWVTLWMQTASPEETAAFAHLTRMQDEASSLIDSLLSAPASTSSAPDEIELLLQPPSA